MLNFDTQKMFTRARNIACVVELKDSDDENAVGLQVSSYAVVLNLFIKLHASSFSVFMGDLVKLCWYRKCHVLYCIITLFLLGTKKLKLDCQYIYITAITCFLHSTIFPVILLRNAKMEWRVASDMRGYRYCVKAN